MKVRTYCLRKRALRSPGRCSIHPDHYNTSQTLVGSNTHRLINTVRVGIYLFNLIDDFMQVFDKLSGVAGGARVESTRSLERYWFGPQTNESRCRPVHGGQTCIFYRTMLLEVMFCRLLNTSNLVMSRTSGSFLSSLLFKGTIVSY